MVAVGAGLSYEEFAQGLPGRLHSSPEQRRFEFETPSIQRVLKSGGQMRCEGAPELLAAISQSEYSVQTSIHMNGLGGANMAQLCQSPSHASGRLGT